MPSPKRGLRTFGAAVSALLLVTAVSAVAAVAGGPNQGQHEDPNLRTSHSATSVDGNGRHTVHVYAGPIHYRDAQGNWQPIDNTLVPDGSGDVTNAANSYRASLPGDASGPVQFTTGRGFVSFQLAGAHGGRVVEGTHATYAGALPGVDVAYAVANAGVKETLTLANASAPTSFDYSLSTTPDLTPRLNKSGGIDFVDPNNGATAFAFAPPSMIDAAGVSSDRVRFQLGHDGTTLTLRADKHWLADRSRVWPVVVDPSFIANGADRECFIRDGADAAASFCGGSSIDVGNDGTQASRTLLVWDLSSIVPSNATVQSATLGLYLQDEANGTPLNVGVHRVTTPWTVSTTWNEADTGFPWTSPGGDFAAAPDATTTVGGSTGVGATWNLTALVQGWVNGSVANDGLLLDGTGGTNVLHFATTSAPQTSEMPYLEVTYDTSPETTITSGPTGSTSSTSATFGFNSDTYGSTFECSLDNAAFAACTSPRAYTSLATGAHTFAVRAISPGGTADPSPANRSWTVTAGAPPPSNLLTNGSFEGSLAGWSGASSSLTLASDGKVGSGAARVARSSGSSFSILTSSKPVTSTAAGAAYTAGGWIRSDTPGRKVCLIVREWTTGGSLVGSRSSCLTSTRSWQQFAANRYVAARNAGTIDVTVTESGAATGDSFEVDGLTLTQG
ncbi:MAG TPA: DNRLRE domain-containing protein [Gaiellaceae bacterium]|jgi:hypothetical protein|nr:DNRLRE domain-containing protein [Gaiellaceae bacterium]